MSKKSRSLYYKVDKYSMTVRARDGYEAFAKYLHITGIANVVSYLIWNCLDIEPTSPELLEDAKLSCIKRIGYVYTPERCTVAITLDEATKQRFEQMYVSVKIDSFSAALDLLGQALPVNIPSETIAYTNGFVNPFVYEQFDDRRVKITAHDSSKTFKISDYFTTIDSQKLKPPVQNGVMVNGVFIPYKSAFPEPNFDEEPETTEWDVEKLTQAFKEKLEAAMYHQQEQSDDRDAFDDFRNETIQPITHLVTVPTSEAMKNFKRYKDLQDIVKASKKKNPKSPKTQTINATLDLSALPPIGAPIDRSDLTKAPN